MSCNNPTYTPLPQQLTYTYTDIPASVDGNTFTDIPASVDGNTYTDIPASAGHGLQQPYVHPDPPPPPNNLPTLIFLKLWYVQNMKWDVNSKQ